MRADTRVMASMFVFFAASLLLSIPLACSGDKGSTEPPEVVWEQTGAIYGGLVNCLARNAEGNIYAGTSAGVYKSSDGGGQWVPLSERLRREYIQGIAVSSTGRLFALTSTCLFRSVDGGVKWSALKLPEGTGGPGALTINNKGHLFVCATTAGARGIYRSMENGYRWVQIGQDISAKRVNCLSLGARDELYAGTSEGVFLSINNGDHWTRLAADVITGNVVAVAADPAGRVLASTEGGVYGSADSGRSWAQLTSSGASGRGAYRIALSSWGTAFRTDYSEGLLRLPKGADRWLTTNLEGAKVTALLDGGRGHMFAAAGMSGVVRSDNDGVTWKEVNTGLTAASIYGIAVARNGSIFASGPGVHRSSDGGKTWKKLSVGQPGAFVFSVAVTPEDIVLAGSSKGEIFVSSDYGETWTCAYDSKNGGIRCFAVDAAGRIYAAGGLTMLVSTDRGKQWTALDIRPPVPAYSLVVSPSGRLIAGCDRASIYYSDDAGASWTRVPEDALQIKWAGARVFGLAVDKQGRILAATEGGLFRSSDNGSTWSNLKGPEGILLTVLADDAGRIWVGYSGGVLVSADDGLTWTRCVNGLPIDYTFSLAVDREGRLLAGTHSRGVYRTTRPAAK